MSTKFDAEKAENLDEIEKQFVPLESRALFSLINLAEDTYRLIQTYWQLLEAVPPKALKLTKMDEDIYNDFLEQFPEYKENPSMVEVIDEDLLKSKENKQRWFKFMSAYEKKVQDYTFGSLLRVDVKDDYTEKNTMFVPRMQFYVFEIARNRLGMNDHVYNSAKSSK
ncbi:polysaccharide biosynthesis protein [Rhizoctonia solani AG-3 Rhs1AP]|uniref:Polysaccharide biosynthesis protein n=2 Tax=Rhizoctonia solani AG-3 TaxID=1086053 RepID=A0A074RQG0_9AGAM|nr:polysaccharide biosynthesis protein [Rhizoctonia solani AG-3 Rhs1AP]KEP49261.1 polysaccharide biosynthesis protein [Rhizoctonia solani 123E]